MNTDPGVVRDLFAGHYFLFAFLTSLGAIQIAVSNAGTRGLWLMPHATMTRWFGIVLLVSAIVIFFMQPLWIDGPWAAGSVEADSLTRDWGKASWDELAGARNVNDIHGGLDGVKQTGWFSLAAVAAFVVSAIVGTLTIEFLSRAQRNSSGDQDSEMTDGLAGLTDRSYLSIQPESWRNFRADIGELWRNGVSEADSWNLIKSILGRSSK